MGEGSGGVSPVGRRHYPGLSPDEAGRLRSAATFVARIDVAANDPAAANPRQHEHGGQEQRVDSLGFALGSKVQVCGAALLAREDDETLEASCSSENWAAGRRNRRMSLSPAETRSAPISWRRKHGADRPLELPPAMSRTRYCVTEKSGNATRNVLRGLRASL